MYLNDLLTEKKMSRYRLAKLSGVPQATVADICSGKAKIEKCSAETLYKIARTLDVSMESLIKQNLSDDSESVRPSFEIFKSNVCHMVKDKGDIDFIIDTLNTDEIRTLYNRKWFAEAFYLLAMIDYLSKENAVPLCTKYDDLRCRKLHETIYPAGVVLSDESMGTDESHKECLKKALPEFLRYNIVESEIRNVC